MHAFERVNDEVYYAGQGVVAIGDEELEYVKARARENPRRRARICTHPSTDSPLHEMFIVHESGAYVRPHAHAVKAESFFLIEGRCDVVLFDDGGGVAAVIPVGTGPGLKRYYRIPERLYHTQLVRSEWLVFHEVTSGPFVRAEMLAAPWSPDDADSEAVAAYVADLERRVRERGTPP
jgi:cupin fold WbuC family metalloprotein